MGRKVNLISILPALLLFLTLYALPSLAARDFPQVTGSVTDLPDVLSDADEQRLAQALDDLKEFNSMPGVIVITDKTDEWDFNEYAHDLLGHLQSEGIVDSTGFLIYVSVGDRKMAFEAGIDLKRGGIINEDEIRDFRQGLDAAFTDGAYFDGLNGVLSELRKLMGAVELDDAKAERGKWMMLGGLIILIAVLFLNLRRKRKQLLDPYE